jgi:hypothetical protein
VPIIKFLFLEISHAWGIEAQDRLILNPAGLCCTPLSFDLAAAFDRLKSATQLRQRICCAHVLTALDILG